MSAVLKLLLHALVALSKQADDGGVNVDGLSRIAKTRKILRKGINTINKNFVVSGPLAALYAPQRRHMSFWRDAS